MQARADALKAPASTRGQPRSGGWTALTREQQDIAWRKLRWEWDHDSEGGEHWGELLMAKPAGERPWSNTAWDVKMRSHYKTHCFNVYGGEHWLRFLLVLGDVAEEAVDATNEALRERVQEKRGVDPCLYAGPRPPDPEWHWHQRQGRPERPQGPSAKTLRV
ncbi:MAG: hypothetical protein GY772_22875, partial [bacterium]|nr:hypothetical protein [bacterium]